MSGHSKWAQIKRQKGANDARKGAVFTKLAREIQVAARESGPDPDANFRLRLAIQKAREANMPAENVKRSIERATSGAHGEQLEEIVYEGYGPGGAALLIHATTDNRNRTVSEIRAVLTRAGGSLGESGCVAWQFEPRGIVVVQAGSEDPDDIALTAIDAGAEDVRSENGVVEIYTQPTNLEAVREALQARQLVVEHAESTQMPTNTVDLDEETAVHVLRLAERIEELEDVARVFTNLNVTEGLLERAAS